jgi:drug/metabolite transporter (DMT)-like permease
MLHAPHGQFASGAAGGGQSGPGRDCPERRAEAGLSVATATAGPGTGTAGGRSLSRPVLRAALGAMCISASAILIPLSHASPTTAAFYRCALPLPVLAILAVAEQRRRGPRPVARRAWAALAGFALAVNLVLWIHSIEDVGAGVATVLGNLQVLFVVAFGWLRLRERPARRFLAALPVVLAGVVMVSGLAGGSGTGSHPGAGVAYGLGTSAAYAIFLLILRQTAGDGRHPVGQLFDATAGAAATALLLGLGFGGLRLALPWRSLEWLLVLAVSSGIVGWLLISSSLPHLPASLSALLLLLEPAAAIVLADLVLSQRPSLIQIAGAVLVCGGVLAVAGKREVAAGPDLRSAPTSGRSGPAAPSAESRAAAPGPLLRCESSLRTTGTVTTPQVDDLQPRRDTRRPQLTSPRGVTD